MPDYDAWDLTDDFTVAQASCRWCDVDPDISFLVQKSQYPQIAAIEQMFVSEITAGRLPADSTRNARSRIGNYSESLVSREALIELAKRKGVTPKFLFPAARQPSSEVQAGAKLEAAWPSGPQGESVPAPGQAPAAKAESALPPPSNLTVRQMTVDWKASHDDLRRKYDHLVTERDVLKARVSTLEAQQAEPQREKDLGPRERETYQKMILGLAKSFDYDPNAKNSPAISKMANALARQKLGVGRKTVHDKLREAAIKLGFLTVKL